MEKVIEEINKAKTQKELFLNWNKFTEMPIEIRELKHITWLSLSNNGLINLPSWIGDLENLEVLTVTDNEISNLPSEIQKLKKLRHLDLSNNKLSKLPTWIGNLRSLEKLYINDNAIKNLPNELGNLENLKFFHFRNNLILSLPKSMKNSLNRMIQNQQSDKNTVGIKYVGVDGNKFSLSDKDTFSLDLEKLVNTLIPNSNVENLQESSILEFSDINKPEFREEKITSNQTQIGQSVSSKISANTVSEEKKKSALYKLINIINKIFKYLTKSNTAKPANSHIVISQWKLYYKAIRENNVELVAKLMNDGFSINSKNPNGFSPLHFAANENCEQITELLVSKGADVNAQSNNLSTPYTMAAASRYNNVIRILSRGELVIDSRANQQISENLIRHSDILLKLSFYTKNRDYDGMKTYIKSLKSPNLCDDRDISLLHTAVQNGNLKQVEILIKNGANINTLDMYEKTPLDTARENKNYEVVEYLESLSKH